jgi:pyridoxal phosphate enzyme (YggS family)
MSAAGVELVAPALERVRERIRRAAEQSGREPGEIRLVAVSKRQPAEKIRAAYAAGQRDFGENYAQELLAKQAELGDLPDLRFHMIGALQRNKVAGLCGVISAVHSVDSLRLIEELGRRASARSVPAQRALLAGGQLAGFLEVNLGEAQKAGCDPSELGRLIDAVLAQPSLSLRGLMAIPAGSEDPESARGQFERLLELREQQGGVARLPELSMGMSRDLEVAIACGSTWVRVGTDIFGERA